jgi:hypothetical protein
MKKHCSKCKLEYTIGMDDVNANTGIPFQTCGKCRELNRKYMNNKKRRIETRSEKTGFVYCMRCNVGIVCCDTGGKYCIDCKEKKCENAKMRRRVAQIEAKEFGEKRCTRCTNIIEEENDDKDKFKTCERCRETDRNSYLRRKLN